MLANKLGVSGNRLRSLRWNNGAYNRAISALGIIECGKRADRMTHYRRKPPQQ
jgi:hypothetical protein